MYFLVSEIIISDKKSEAALKCVIVLLPAPSKRGVKGPKPSAASRVGLFFTDFEVCEPKSKHGIPE